LAPRNFSQVARVAQQARDAGERLEMLGAGRERRQQRKHQINRLIVDRLERHRPFQAGEDPVKPRQLGEPAMRDRDAGADPGRAEPLALGEGVIDPPVGDAGHRRGASRHLLQNLPLGRRRCAMTLRDDITAAPAHFRSCRYHRSAMSEPAVPVITAASMAAAGSIRRHPS
jgi:hypothetical protein